MKRFFERMRPVTTLFAFITVITLVLTAQSGCSKREKTPEEKTKEETVNLLKAQGHFNKGNDLLGAKKYDEAIKEYEESIKLHPTSPETHSNLGYAYLDKFNAAKDKEDPAVLDKSLQHQRKATELNPNLAVAYYGIALTLELIGDPYGALESWHQFLKLSPSDTQWSDNAKKHIKAIEEFIKKREKDTKKAHQQQKAPPHKKQ